jgi:aminopeptidase N
VKLAALLLVAVCPLAAERRYSVAHYDVRITPDLAAQRVAGTETIRFRAPAGPVELDAGPLAIQSVTEDGRPVPFEHRGRLLLVPGDRRRLTLHYRAGPAKGLVFFPGQVYSSFFTSDWMVCDDRPEDRATLALTIDAPGLRVESSGRLETPTPSFLYGFAAGQFAEVQSNRLRVLGAGPEVFEPTGAAMRFLAEKSGKPYPNPIYTQVFTKGNVEQEVAHFTLMPQA